MDNDLDPVKNLKSIKDGLMRLKILWDMRKEDEEMQIKQQAEKLRTPRLTKKFSSVETKERKERIKTKMKIEANMKSLCVLIPLYAEIESS